MNSVYGSDIIDISPILTANTAVWPGDTPLSRNIFCDIGKGAHLDLSSLTTTVHIGAHADAPRHYHSDGVSIDLVPLDAYIGPCVVSTVLGKRMIEVDDCRKVVTGKVKRILFRTLTFDNQRSFNENFTSFTPEAIDYLGSHGVILIGIDTPSFDSFDSKTLESHKMLYKYKMANLECLCLEHVQDGSYELIALPLKLEGFDASPVRAILRR